MPWLNGAEVLPLPQKLAILQAALEAAFRDRLVVKGAQGEVLFSNQKTSIRPWQWKPSLLQKEETHTNLVLRAQLPDAEEIQQLYLEGLQSSPLPVSVEILSPQGDEAGGDGDDDVEVAQLTAQVQSSVAHLATCQELQHPTHDHQHEVQEHPAEQERSISSGGERGPPDRVRRVRLSLPTLPTVPTLPPQTRGAGLDLVAAAERPPMPATTLTAEVASDPFGRQVLIAHLFNLIPSGLLIAREMPRDPARPETKDNIHVIFLNDALVAQTGFQQEDIVVAPDPTQHPPLGLARLIHHEDLPTLLKFWRTFFDNARAKRKEDHRSQAKAEQAKAERAAMVAGASAEVAAGGMTISEADAAIKHWTLPPGLSSDETLLMACDIGVSGPPKQRTKRSVSWANEEHEETALAPSPSGSIGSTATNSTVTTAPALSFGSAGSGVEMGKKSVAAIFGQPPAEKKEAVEEGLEAEPSKSKPAIEFRLMNKDGSSIWMRGEGTSIICPFDGTTKLAFTMVNVDERRSLRSQLEDKRNVVSSLVDKLPVPVAVATPDGKVKQNEQYRTIFGFVAGQMYQNNATPGIIRDGSSTSPLLQQTPSSQMATPSSLSSDNLFHDPEQVFEIGECCTLYKLPPSILEVPTGSPSELATPAPPGAGPNKIGTNTDGSSVSAGSGVGSQTESSVASSRSCPTSPLDCQYHQLLREGILKPYRRSEYPLTRTMITGETVAEERAVIHNRETNIFTPITICSRPVYTHKGDLVAGVATIQDISSIVREEKAKGELVVAEQAAAATRDLLSVASHESRTPLAAILAMTSFLEDGPLTAEQKECVDAIKESGRLLLTLISDLLDFNRIEAGKLELERRLFSPYELLRHVTKMMASYGKARNITVDLATEEHDLFKRCLVVGDSQRLSQIVFNLASNACKFSNVGGKVVIRASAVAKPIIANQRDTQDSSEGTTHEVAVTIAVTDQGQGMTPSGLAKIRLFLPFTQEGSGVARKAGGAGLGLHISSRLLSLMGSKMEVDSEEGKGSSFSFTVTLPGKVLPSTAQAQAEANAVSGQQQQRAFPALKISAPQKMSGASVATPSLQPKKLSAVKATETPALPDFSPTVDGWGAVPVPDKKARPVSASTAAQSSPTSTSFSPADESTPVGSDGDKPRRFPRMQHSMEDELTRLRTVVSPRAQKGTRTFTRTLKPSPRATAVGAIGHLGASSPSLTSSSALSPSAQSSPVADQLTSSSALGASVDAGSATTVFNMQHTGGNLFTWQGLAPLTRATPPTSSVAVAAKTTETASAVALLNATAAAAAIDSGATQPHRRILVAEDNKMNQKIMLRYLAKLGFAGAAMVTVVDDGNAAVQELKRAFLSPDEKCYDLVLMDCLMPQYDGYWGCRAIRALPYECSDVSVVAVTASTLQSDIDRAAASGFEGHLSKPYTAEELKEALDRWMPKTPGPAEQLAVIAEENEKKEEPTPGLAGFYAGVVALQEGETARAAQPPQPSPSEPIAVPHQQMMHKTMTTFHRGPTDTQATTTLPDDSSESGEGENAKNSTASDSAFAGDGVATSSSSATPSSLQQGLAFCATSSFSAASSSTTSPSGSSLASAAMIPVVHTFSVNAGKRPSLSPSFLQTGAPARRALRMARTLSASTSAATASPPNTTQQALPVLPIVGPSLPSPPVRLGEVGPAAPIIVASPLPPALPLPLPAAPTISIRRMAAGAGTVSTASDQPAQVDELDKGGTEAPPPVVAIGLPETEEARKGGPFPAGPPPKVVPATELQADQQHEYAVAATNTTTPDATAPTVNNSKRKKGLFRRLWAKAFYVD